MGQGARSTESETRRYGFAGVELDAATYSMRVDGHPVNCSRKAFDLLLQLCLKPDRVQTRDELIAALWPGGQIVSDEALTQVIFRARAVLGRYAPQLLTVRGVGLRLDGDVRVLAATPPVAMALPNPPNVLRRVTDQPQHAVVPVLPPTPSTDAVAVIETPAAIATVTAKPWWRRWRWQWVLLLVLLGVGVGLWQQGRNAVSPQAMIDAGYGLLESDLHAQQAGTADLLREAFLNDARGERARGRALLEAVHASDAATPVPAIFLALWSAGAGDGASANTWLQAARKRVGDARDVYLNLLLDYVEAEANGTGPDVIRQAGAILDIRPGAWRMRSARSHLMSAEGMRDAALNEVKQIEVSALGHRKLEMVIADRASMGDVAGAQAMLDRLPKGDDVAALAFLNGRIAWTRGDFDAAHAFFSEAAQKGFEAARSDLQQRALINLAAIEVMRRHDDAAIEALERARVGMNEAGKFIDEIDTSLFLAELHARAGREAQMQVELDRALAVSERSGESGMRLIAALTAQRLRPGLQIATPADLPADAAALWKARQSLNRGDRGAADAALTDARRRGVFEGKLVDEARFLAIQVGQPVPAEQPIDPPYPPLAVFVLRRDVRDLLDASKP